jgi:phenylalanyl-tRNA synthetase beta chain
MKISYNWLKKYIATNLPPSEVGKLLTEVGLEVEHIEPFESVKGGLKGLVIGEVKTCIKHPNADKLSLTTVDIGVDKLLNIVCGAPNVAAGQKVVVALVGTKLFPSEGEPFTIQKSKIRGEYSEGMICAEDEIGLGTSHAGIIILLADTKAGTPASEYFQIYSDSVFEIGVTPNRADALCHIGVARDLVASINLRSKVGTQHVVSLQLPETDELKTAIESTIAINVENREACKRYTGAEIRGIEVKDSPQWLKNYLSAIGLRPINNIVDVTNFVMLETGQPLHAFDADKIKGKRVVVRKPNPDESIITLDGVERKLKPEDLLICNESEAMCIAGVYGGMKSGVTETTKNIFLESACFDATHIRRTSRNHRLHTDASYRFERGTDANITTYALMRAIDLVQGGNSEITVSKIQDVYPIKIEEMKLEFSLSYSTKLSGHIIPGEKIAEILEAAGIKILEKSEDKWMLSIPTYRMDITNQADIVEEILRFYGYNNIPIPGKLKIPLVHSRGKKTDEIIDMVGNFLSSLGFSEIMNTSLSSSKFEENENTVRISNPLSQDLNILRGNLLFNGLTNITLNQNNKNPDLKLYEFGRTYHKGEGGKYKETEHLSLWICGNKSAVSWNNKEQQVDFFHLKLFFNAVIEKITGIVNPTEITIDDSSIFSYATSLNKSIGFTKMNSRGINVKMGEELIYELLRLGKIKQEILDKWGIKGDVFFADIPLKKLFNLIPKGLEVKEINKFPSVTRDLALIIDKNMQFSALKEIAVKSEKELLKEVSVFDVYEGKGIENDKKSYALRFILQSETRTLNDKEIDKVMEKLSAAFTEKAGAIIRIS